MQPELNPTPAPAPTPPADPFASFGAPAPEPAPVVDPAPADPIPAPADPAPAPEPAPVSTDTPVEPAAPVADPAPAAPTEEYQSYEDYMDSVLAGIDAPEEPPKLSDINQDDPAAIQEFFDKWGSSIYQKAITDVERKTAIQNSERRLWDETFATYPTLKSNDNLRGIVHSIRMTAFNKGVAMTPTQAAQQLLQSMNSEYKRGVTDNQVVTTIANSQPTGGGTVEVAPENKTTDMTAIQDGGEQALAAILDREIKAGRM